MEMERKDWIYEIVRCKIVRIWKWIEYRVSGRHPKVSLDQRVMPFSELRVTRRGN